VEFIVIGVTADLDQIVTSVTASRLQRRARAPHGALQL
jgi:hypothetical protein